jgi:UDP-3-O-[3-hydroxymyristoyl] glucosamine N-acyltransferase
MILGHLRIADKTTVSPGTMITKSITKSGEKFTSIMPFLKHRDWLKFASKLKQFGKKDD